MEVVELGRFVFGVNGGHQRIAHRFHHAIAQSNHQSGQEEGQVAVGENGEQNAAQMHQEGQVDQGFHAQAIHQHTANYHGNGKAPKGGRRNRADLTVGQGKLALQII